jgi:protein TonB
VEFEPIELGGRARRRMAAAFASSAIVHALAFALLLSVRPTAVTRPIMVLPVSLVSMPGGGDGSERAGGGDASRPPAEAPAPEAPAPPVAEPAPPPPTQEAARPKPVPKPKHPAEPKPVEPSRSTASKPAAEPAPSAVASVPRSDAVAPGDGGGGGSGGGAGPGGGTGAGFGSGASAGYGVNPEPPYPIAARRLGLQGTVVLRVVVAPDGSPTSVAVIQSSGHAMLDESAVDTVRTKWRFVPARRNGVPVEDTVQVPIRFKTTTG